MPLGSAVYEVHETDQFHTDWRRAVSLGYIDPMVHPPALFFIKNQVSADPYGVLPAPGAPSNVRRIRLTERVGLWYGIVEDDKVVHLFAVRILGDD